VLWVISAFFGREIGLYAALIVVFSFILWEVYFIIKERKDFSWKDVVVGIITLLPYITTIHLAG
jgi:hypothetical protein